MTRLRLAPLAAIAAVALVAAGCNLDPRTTTLPGGIATGSDGYTVKAEFTNVDNLVDNAEVLYRNVRIGTVRAIEAKSSSWRATVSISLKKNLRLPANVTATIGQKSLLGAQYVQIDDPSTPSENVLANGDAIPIARTAQYPETEDVLAATSMLLNYGGLSQIKTITTELNHALHGRTGVSRDLITRLNTFVGRLNDQRNNLIDAISKLNDLSKQLADDRTTVARALTRITPAVATLNADRSNLTTALVALNGLSKVATKVIARNKQGLATDLALLRPAVTKLAEAGSAVPRSLPLLATFPFPVSTIDRAARGDYMNVYVTLDLTTKTVSRDFGLDLKDSDTAKNAAALQQILNAILGGGNPLTNPLKGLTSVPTKPSGQIPLTSSRPAASTPSADSAPASDSAPSSGSAPESGSAPASGGAMGPQPESGTAPAKPCTGLGPLVDLVLGGC